MPIPEVHSPDQADHPTRGDAGGEQWGGEQWGEEQYSPAFAAWALLLTLGVLAAVIAAIWVSAGWPASAS